MPGKNARQASWMVILGHRPADGNGDFAVSRAQAPPVIVAES